MIIPTRNRADSLRRAIESALAQTVSVEILVLDDGSTDDTQRMIARDFPVVRYERFEENRGPCFLRNHGGRLASTNHLVTLDDDCVLQSRRTVEQTLRLFDSPRIGAVTIPFIDVGRGNELRQGPRQGDPDGITYDFCAGMVALRRDAFEGVGGYRTSLFMHVEEPDLSIRLLSSGFVIRVGDADPIHHFESPIRDRTRLNRLGPRNHVLFCWYNVPMPYLMSHAVGTALLALRHSLRAGYFWTAAVGTLSGVVACLSEWRQRRPVKSSVYRLSRRLKHRQPVRLAEIMSDLPPLAKASP